MSKDVVFALLILRTNQGVDVDSVLNIVMENTALIISGIGSAVAGAVLAFYFSSLAERRQRLHALYAEAFRDAMAWREILHIIRRRKAGDEADYRIISRVHELQEKLSYNEGWISSDSVWIGRSYKKLIRVVKSKLESLIQDAWENPLKPSWASPTITKEEREANKLIEEESRRFIRDVRLYHAGFPLFFLKIAPILRNIHWWPWGKQQRSDDEVE